jgi:thiamine-phosphate pyrophosphorylase
VTNDRVHGLADLVHRAHCLAATPGIVAHARSESGSTRALMADALRFRVAGMPVLVNDRVDVVPGVRALGVHLPSHGLPVVTARRLLGPHRLVGRSTHDAEEARAAAADGADYVFLGPIWPTPSHPGRPGIGIAAIRHAAPARVIAIGGVTPERVRLCIEAGAWGVAAISALWLAEDPAAAAAEFLLCLAGR